MLEAEPTGQDAETRHTPRSRSAKTGLDPTAILRHFLRRLRLATLTVVRRAKPTSTSVPKPRPSSEFYDDPQQMNVLAEWRRVRAKIDSLEGETEETVFPCPTQRMCLLLIVGEDHRYGSHPGVDVVALCRAVWNTYFHGLRQGGSTIAMQLVRRLTGRYKRTVSRKLSEIVLAVCVTRYVPKERIPILYLRCAYYGWRMNDFGEACKRLKLTPETAGILAEAELVARLKYPQPRQCSPERMSSIRTRGLHLIRLLNDRNRS